MPLRAHGDIVHLETETKVVETDFPAKFLIEAVTEDKVAELHVVGMFDGSVTDSAGGDVAAVLCRHPAVGGNLIAIPVAKKVAGEGSIAESALVAGSSGCGACPCVIVGAHVVAAVEGKTLLRARSRSI